MQVGSCRTDEVSKGRSAGSSSCKEGSAWIMLRKAGRRRHVKREGRAGDRSCSAPCTTCSAWCPTCSASCATCSAVLRCCDTWKWPLRSLAWAANSARSCCSCRRSSARSHSRPCCCLLAWGRGKGCMNTAEAKLSAAR